MTYVHMTKDGSEVFLAHQVYGTEMYQLVENNTMLNIETRYFMGYMIEHPRDIHNCYVFTSEALDKKSVRIGQL